MDLVITDSPQEMASIGRHLFNEKSDIYNEALVTSIRDAIEANLPGASSGTVEDAFYRSIYDYWVYGNTVNEEFYYNFRDKSHAEKTSYMVCRQRLLYVAHLNDMTKIDILNDKYKAYEALKPYYGRDVIKLTDECDFGLFRDFVTEHSKFVVKPLDLGQGIGVRKVEIPSQANLESAFAQLLEEGRRVSSYHTWSKSASIVLEELIDQSEEMASFHPESVNAIRATAVKTPNGLRIIHPWLKVGMNGTFVASAAFDGFDAEIDPQTGTIITDGHQENGMVYRTHPNTGVTIRGFQIPYWNDLVKMVSELHERLPFFGYVGWDLVLTSRGWCVMEGNYAGEFSWQFIRNQGMKQEFEELIEWKPDKQFWWQA